jgi:hypothetical protein
MFTYTDFLKRMLVLPVSEVEISNCYCEDRIVHEFSAFTKKVEVFALYGLQRSLHPFFHAVIMKAEPKQIPESKIG